MALTLPHRAALAIVLADRADGGADAGSDVALRQAARLGAAGRRAEDAARGRPREGAGRLRPRSGERRRRDLARPPARVSRALPRRDRRLHARHRAASERAAALPPPRAPLHHDPRSSTRRSPICGGPSQLVAGKPDEVEPDGAPNKAGHSAQHAAVEHLVSPRPRAVPAAAISQQALASYREGMKVSRVNDDMLVATSDWLYMTLRRLKRDAEARQVLEPIKRADGRARERRLSRAAADVQGPARRRNRCSISTPPTTSRSRPRATASATGTW